MVNSKHYLFVKHGTFSWAIYSSLKGEKGYLQSASCGHPCAAHKSNSKNEKYKNTAWRVNNSKEEGEEDWKVTTTEILVSCETHGCNNQN